MTPWPHQISGVRETLAAIERGVRRLCLASPTGGGKSLMMEMLIRNALDQGKRCSLYTNRRLPLDQIPQT